MKVLTEDGAALEFDLKNKRVRSIEGYGLAQKGIPNSWSKYESITLPIKGFGMEIYVGESATPLGGPRFYLPPILEVFEVSLEDEEILGSIADGLHRSKELL